MSLNINVREACESDLLTLIEYGRALAKESENLSLNQAILRKGIRRALELNDCHYFVADLEGKVIGQAMVTSEWSDWRNGIIWWLQSVYVKPELRKRGVFTNIFKHIETLAKRKTNVKALRLYVTSNNNIAMSAYETLGMNNSGYIVYEKSN